MAKKLDKATSLQLATQLQDYLLQEMELEASQLQCQLLLDFIQDEIGPHIYNGAVSDTQEWLHQQVDELNLHCFATPKFKRR